MPRKLRPKLCSCGCGRFTRGGHFLPGHDARVYSAIIERVGDIRNLREVVEQYTGKKIEVETGTIH